MIHLSSLFESQYESDRMRFLERIHKIRNMLKFTYNNFQQQFLEFQNDDKNRIDLQNSDILSLETKFLAENDTSFSQPSIQTLNQKQNTNGCISVFLKHRTLTTLIDTGNTLNRHSKSPQFRN